MAACAGANAPAAVGKSLSSASRSDRERRRVGLMGTRFNACKLSNERPPLPSDMLPGQAAVLLLCAWDLHMHAGGLMPRQEAGRRNLELNALL